MPHRRVELDDTTLRRLRAVRPYLELYHWTPKSESDHLVAGIRTRTYSIRRSAEPAVVSNYFESLGEFEEWLEEEEEKKASITVKSSREALRRIVDMCATYGGSSE